MAINTKLDGDISTRPVSDNCSLMSDKPSKPSGVSSLPSIEYLSNVIGTGNKGRSDIMTIYSDFINLPDDERLPSYGILLNVLLEYVNYDVVTGKAIDVINRYPGANQCVLTKLSDIRWGSVDHVPINILDKMVTRLTTHWVPERIVGAEAIVHLSKSTGVPETMFFKHSEFYADSACTLYVSARKAGLVVNSVIQECKDLVINANPEYDYYPIEYSYLPEIHQSMSHFIDFEVSGFNNDFVDDAFVDNITNLCKDNGIDLFVLLNPFCHYPDARLITKSLSDDIMAYFKYLITVKSGDIVYPSDVQCIDIISEAVKNNTDVFGVAKLCTGNCFVQVSDIPLNMLQDAGYLLG